MPRFTASDAALQARKSNTNRKPGRQGRALKQAVQLQDALVESGLALHEDLKAMTDLEQRARSAAAIASVAKGWQALQDQIRILRGRPLPGSLRPEKAKPKHPKPSALIPMPSESSTDQASSA